MQRSLKGQDRAKHLRGLMDERAEPGIHGLTYESAASIGIGRDEDIRAGSVGELRQQAGMAPVEARVKVFVVSDAGRMTTEAANSLLKVLEEPPEENLIVLTARRPNELLDTIVSRCQSIRFRDLDEEEMVALLLERANIVATGDGSEEERRTTAAHLAAALSGGSLARAADLAELDVTAERDRALELLGSSPGDPRLHERIGSLIDEKNRSLVERLLDFGLLWQSDLLRAATGSELPLANHDCESLVRAEAAATTVEAIRARVRALEAARRALAGNVYLKLVLYNLIQGMAGRPTAGAPTY
jgi:DNA polymerase-3 subunit delta'